MKAGALKIWSKVLVLSGWARPDLVSVFMFPSCFSQNVP
jgi:hypothetical protein